MDFSTSSPNLATTRDSRSVQEPVETWWRDQISDNPRALDYLFVKTVGWRKPLMPASRLIRTEFRVPGGRIDLLILSAGLLVVVEFKRGTADEDAVAQVLRYCGPLDSYGTHPAIVAHDFTHRAVQAAQAAQIRFFQMAVGSLTVCDKASEIVNGYPGLDPELERAFYEQHEIELAR